MKYTKAFRAAAYADETDVRLGFQSARVSKILVASSQPRKPVMAAPSDLTVNGCYLEMMFTLEIGMKLKITLVIDDTKVSTGATVVTRLHNRGNGIEFTDMSPEDRGRLKQFLASIQDARSPR